MSSFRFLVTIFRALSSIEKISESVFTVDVLLSLFIWLCQK